ACIATRDLAMNRCRVPNAYRSQAIIHDGLPLSPLHSERLRRKATAAGSHENRMYQPPSSCFAPCSHAGTTWSYIYPDVKGMHMGGEGSAFSHAGLALHMFLPAQPAPSATAQGKREPPVPPAGGVPFLIRFTGSVHGLETGAAVEIRGIRIGDVVSVDLEYD